MGSTSRQKIPASPDLLSRNCGRYRYRQEDLYQYIPCALVVCMHTYSMCHGMGREQEPSGMKERKREMAGARQNQTYHHHFRDQDRELDKYAFMPTSSTCQARTLDSFELFGPQQAQGNGRTKTNCLEKKQIFLFFF